MARDQETATPIADRVASLEKALAELTRYMYLVLHHDWEHSASMLEDDQGFYIASTETFLNPKVRDESNNWGNRGGLLDAYRQAVATLRENGIDPEKL